MFYNSIVVLKLLIFFPNLVDHFHGLGDDVVLVILGRLHQAEGAESLAGLLAEQLHVGLQECLIHFSPASPGERGQLQSEGDVQSGPISPGLSLLLDKSLRINTESFLLARLKSKSLHLFIKISPQSSLRGSSIFMFSGLIFMETNKTEAPLNFTFKVSSIFVITL